MHTSSDKIEFMIAIKIDEIVEDLFTKIQKNLEELMKESEFVFDSVELIVLQTS